MGEHNVVVLRGTLVREGRVTELPSGSVVVGFDVRTRDDTGTESVPVAWFDPPPGGLPVGPGEDVVVVGRLRRRFFRAGGTTQSRTEVVAERVVKAARAADANRAVAAARRLLE